MKRIIFGIGRFLGAAGRATVALIGIAGLCAALANYTMTQGSGTTFGSILVGGFHYVQMLSCDPTTPAQCGAVTATGGQIVDVATAGNQLHTDLISPSNGIAGTTPTTQTAVGTGATSKIQTDLNGNLYIAPSQVFVTGPATTALSMSTVLNSQYPTNSVTTTPSPITASTTGTTAATTATLAGVASKTTFICGFTITSDATAAIAGAATVTGTITGTLNYIQNVGSATSAGQLQQTFNPCIPASAANTGIAVNSVAAGTGGNTAVTAWGYQL